MKVIAQSSENEYKLLPQTIRLIITTSNNYIAIPFFFLAKHEIPRRAKGAVVLPIIVITGVTLTIVLCVLFLD